MSTPPDPAAFWKRKLAAYLHDPPGKVLDIAWHKQRAEDYEKGLALDDAEFARDCDHTAAAADRLPWPRWQFLECAFDGAVNFFKHPLGGKTADGQPAGFRIKPYSHADTTHHFASLNRPQLTQGDDRTQFFASWRLWRWWASDNKDSRLAFLPADTRLPDHTIWVHNAIVSALQACVTGEGSDAVCRPAFLLFQIGPVQEYIAQARRTLDLWSGGCLLSYLIGSGLKHIALSYGPDCVIVPNLRGQPIFDLLLKDDIWIPARVQTPESQSGQTLWDSFGYDTDYGRPRLLTPSLPNRFLAVLPADRAADVARKVEEAVRKTHEAISSAVWDWAVKNLKEAACWTVSSVSQPRTTGSSTSLGRLSSGRSAQKKRKLWPPACQRTKSKTRCPGCKPSSTSPPSAKPALGKLGPPAVGTWAASATRTALTARKRPCSICAARTLTRPACKS